MYEAVFIAATGLKHQQLRLDTIANNVSNINTVGFKATRLDFKDALYTANSLGPLGSPEENHQKGHGVMAAANGRLHTNGSLIATEGQLDFAIEGPGFFETENANGQILYNRGGNLYLSDQGDGQGLYLVNSQGSFVRDTQGNRIVVPEGTEAIGCDEAGRLTFEGVENAPQVQIALYTFPNVKGLESMGIDNFRPSVASGDPALAGETVVIRQGALEASNVSMGEEMTRMIRAQRAFSLASRALTTADEMEGIANNMRR